MDVNQEFNKKFREVGVAEFFRKNLQMLGYSGAIRSFTTIIHESTTNGLDACEEYGILPEIKIKIKDIGSSKKSKGNTKLEKLQEKLNEAERAGKPGLINRLKVKMERVENEIAGSSGHYIISIEDNGPGVPSEYIPKVFGSMLSGTKFHRYVQSRGQQGIGAVGAVLFGQMTTGKPTKIMSSTGAGKTSIVFLKVDVDKNSAEIIEENEVESDWKGTKLVTEFKKIIYRKGEQGPFEYLRRTAIANPHATIILEEPNKKKTIWRRTAKSLPPLPKEMKPHPLGLSADDLLRFAKRSNLKKVSKFLQSSFSRISSNRSKEVIKIAKVEDKEPQKLIHSEAERLTTAFKTVKLLSPSTEGLIPIGENHLTTSLKKILNAKFISVLTRKPSVYRGGIPFQVEVALAYGGGAGKSNENGKKMEIMRFANKSPLLFDTGSCAISKSVRSVNWKNYNISDLEKAPLTIFVNIISPHIPYKSAGKQALADNDEVMKEIRFAVMDVARRLKRYLSGMKREAIKIKRRSIFLKYAPEVAWALGVITDKDQEKIEAKLIKIIRTKVKLKEEKEEAEKRSTNK